LVKERGPAAVQGRSLATTAMVFTFFQVFPHVPVGISAVHLILGSTLLKALIECHQVCSLKFLTCERWSA
jgi:hypothetical protein